MNSSVVYELVFFRFDKDPDFLTDEEKSDWLQELSGVCLGSDAFFPFSDNIDRAHLSGVSYIAAPGGSTNDANVVNACNVHDIVMAHTTLRLFHH